jgi:hypothetical protein
LHKVLFVQQRAIAIRRLKLLAGAGVAAALTLLLAPAIAM